MPLLCRTFALFIVLVGLTGCDSIYTDNPIGASPTTETDARLTGGWKYVIPPEELKKSPGEELYCFLLPAKDGGIRGVMAFWSAGRKSDSGDITFDALSGKAGDYGFLNVQHIVSDGKPDEDEPQGYRPYRYRLGANETLEVFDWSPEGLEKLKADIERGRIKGTVTTESTGTDDTGKPIRTTKIQITADQKTLDAYFAANATRIFDKPAFVMQRISE